MNILAFSNCPIDPLLGSGKTRRAWADGLTAMGHTVEIVDSDALLGAEKENPKGRRLRLGRAASARLGAMDLSRVDLIEFYGAEFWLPTWQLSKRPRARRSLLVSHTDGLELLAVERLAAATGQGGGWRGWLVGVANRLAFSRADGFVTGCEADRRFALARGLARPERIAVIPPGLDAEYLAEPAPRADDPEREERVAFFGSWIPRKGTPVLTSALTELLRARPNLRVSLLGTGGGAEAREAFPEPLRGRVEAPGKLPTARVIETLASAKVFFFPSEYEGFGLALAEAMACGCAAVTTPTGFGAELTDDDEALIRPFGDAPGMRAAVERLLDDDALRVRLATAGQGPARRLRWEDNVRRLEETYRKWLAE